MSAIPVALPSDIVAHISGLCTDKDRQTLLLVDKTWARHACASSTTHKWRVGGAADCDFAAKLAALKKFKPHLKQLTLDFDAGSVSSRSAVHSLLCLPVQTLVINVDCNNEVLVQLAACLSNHQQHQQAVSSTKNSDSCSEVSSHASTSTTSSIGSSIGWAVKGLGMGLLLGREKQGKRRTNTKINTNNIEAASLSIRLCGDIQINSVTTPTDAWLPAAALTQVKHVERLDLRSTPIPPSDCAAALQALCQPDPELGRRVGWLLLKLTDRLCYVLAATPNLSAAFASLKHFVVSNYCMCNDNVTDCCIREATAWIECREDLAIRTVRGRETAQLICANQRLWWLTMMHKHPSAMIASGLAQELARSLPPACRKVTLAGELLYEPMVVGVASVFLRSNDQRCVEFYSMDLCRKTCLCAPLAWHHFADHPRAQLGDQFSDPETAKDTRTGTVRPLPAPYQALLDELAEESPELHAMWSLLRRPDASP